MNGFANSMISLLLGWLKVLIRDGWQLLSGEAGGAFLRWLAAHWKGLVLILCLCGLVIDRVVYLIRWRPYYVWRSRRQARRLRRQQQQEEPVCEQEPAYEQEPVYGQEPCQQPVYQQPVSEKTQVFPPVQQDVEPVYDDEPIQWQPEEQWQQQPTFGTSRPEPIHQLRDVQAGFARQKPPEQLYTPRTESRGDVHPGLDEEAIRHSFGLDEQPQEEQPLFHPLTWQPLSRQQPQKNPSAFSRIARKARELVSMGDEENAPTIRDLQPPVNGSQAFHDPVFPQGKHWQDGDEE